MRCYRCLMEFQVRDETCGEKTRCVERGCPIIFHNCYIKNANKVKVARVWQTHQDVEDTECISG